MHEVQFMVFVRFFVTAALSPAFSVVVVVVVIVVVIVVVVALFLSSSPSFFLRSSLLFFFADVRAREAPEQWGG